MMEKANSTLGSLARTKSDQLVGTMSSPSGEVEGTGPATAKSSRRTMSGASPGGTTSSKDKNTRIRKARSVQLQKVDIDDDVSYGPAALSRASSASLGMSFSYIGFSVPPGDMADSRQFSDDDIPEDLEAGTRMKRIKTEPTLPIYLKVTKTPTPRRGWKTLATRMNYIHGYILLRFSLFKEASYKVTLRGVTKSQEKNILQGITGSVNPGEVLALMGPSGSGKTTLLNLLGGRLTQPGIGGFVTYNDQPFSKTLKSRIGFVTQDDVLFPHLTVKETLTYAAYLRLPQSLTRQQKEERAMDVICELGLERCQDTMIGGSFVRGVSGGERKRVSIGNEILVNPSLLFLDEPTSGLDSTTALKTIQILQDIAEAGKTVLTTIHQPSSRLFYKFDKLVLLGKGSLLYFGKALKAMDYFASIGCSPLIAMNPAEFLLDLANGNANDMTVPSELKDKVQTGNLETKSTNGKPSPTMIHEYLVEAYKSRVAEKKKRKLTGPIPIDEEFKSKISSVKREWGASWFEQYNILFWRGLKERRHEYFSWLRITQVLATAVILGMLWWQSDSTTQNGLQDQTGLLFFIAVFWSFFPVFTAIFTFPQERAMLIKERSADMYNLSAYFLARTTSDLPLDLVLPVIFLGVVYFMANLRMDAETFFMTLLVVLLCIVAAQGLGLAIGASLMDLKKATTLGSVTVMTFMLAGGYFVKKVPFFISWIRYLSFNYHTYKLLLKIQYEDHPRSPNVLKFDNGSTEIAALIAMVFGYRLLAYLSLRTMQLHS